MDDVEKAMLFSQLLDSISILEDWQLDELLRAIEKEVKDRKEKNKDNV